MLLSGLVLLTGCASMPSSGEVHKVGGEKHADTDPQVRVFGVKPQGGETPSDIVSGFLEAITSDEADYATAKLYLTKDQGKRWKPESGITVLAGGIAQAQEPGTTTDGKDGDSTQITLSGTKVATVDERHAYTAENGTFSSGLRLTKEDGEWRIAGVADGLVLSEADFQRFYRSVDTFYFASPGRAPRTRPPGTPSSPTRSTCASASTRSATPSTPSSPGPPTGWNPSSPRPSPRAYGPRRSSSTTPSASR